MNKVILTKWGNSFGVRIPLSFLKEIEAYPGEPFELTATEEGGLMLSPIKNPQQGWLEAFNQTDQNEKIDFINNDFDEDEWKW